MKKLIAFLLTIPTLLFTSCHAGEIDKSKIALDYGYYHSNQIVSWTQFDDLDYDDLDALISNKLSFVLITYHSTTCGCFNDFHPLLVEFANEFNYDFKFLDVSELKGKKEKFDIYSGESLMPGIVFIKRGKVIRQTIYGKVSENSRQMFKEYVHRTDPTKGFKPYMLKNVYLPKMYYTDKEIIDEKITNNEEFNLYVGRKTCFDCIAINTKVLYKWSAAVKEVDEKLYILDLDPYYASEPRIDDPEYDTKIIKYTEYINLKKKYGLAYSEDGNVKFGFEKGSVPTFQRRIGEEVKDMITVLNDYADLDTGIVTSYFNESRIQNSPLLQSHLNEYLYDGITIPLDKIESWGSVTQSLQLEWHTPIVELYLNTYVK